MRKAGFCRRGKHDEQRPVYQYPGTEAQSIHEHLQLRSVPAGLSSLPPCQDGYGLVQAECHHSKSLSAWELARLESNEELVVLGKG